MSQKLVCALISLMLVPALVEASRKGKQASQQIVGNRDYFYDNSVERNRSVALAYCKEQGGELAKMTDKLLYDFLRSLVNKVGYYWIDGTEKESKDRFVHSTNCTTDELNFDQIPEANLDFRPRTCLALRKGADAASTRIEALSCVTLQIGVICSRPVDTDCPNLRLLQ